MHQKTHYNKKNNLFKKDLVVIFINLGSPLKLDYFSLVRFYASFLGNKRVITAPLFVRLMILAVIFISRPFIIIGKYRDIWRKKSPLHEYAEQFVSKIKDKYNKDGVVFDYANQFGDNNIKAKIESYHKQNYRKFLFVPLYPQYSSSLQGAIHEIISKEMTKFKWVPDYYVMPSYHNDPEYIKLIAEKISLAKGENLIMSYHGIPHSEFEKGDPYYCFCRRTTRLVKEEYNKNRGGNVELVDDKNFFFAFQSRFGPKKWLKPYLDKYVVDLIKQGKDNLVVMSPGFSFDCLETLHELDIELRELFFEEKGKKFRYIPCLNDDDGHVDFFIAKVDKLRNTFSDY